MKQPSLLATNFSGSSLVDDYIADTIRRETISRKIWLYFSMTVLTSVGVFIALQ